MEWEGREESENVEDRRGMGRGAGIAIGGVTGVVVLVLALLLGIDPGKLGLGGGGGGGGPGGPQNAPPAQERPEEAKLAHFTKVIFGDTERVWTEVFRKQLNKEYRKPTLVLFRDETATACGEGQSAMGPFYCPPDSTVYIDLSFFPLMDRKLQAPGDFAHAYVVAHEVGHHVQKLLGYSSGGDRHQGSVRLELQADYLAGVWAHYGDEKYHFLQPGDVEAAMNAAHQIGDDYLQKRAGRPVSPENFTHGSSKQRMKWFMEGLRTGSIEGAKQLFDLPYDRL
jgi:predicted metalloprotease